ncbi:MAG: hypothetical protein LBF88_01215 [Planctomycetaceae bacterium]|jgi:hypothetical protein|nr:hypothetical protein [Planctomycetaceae bacterium]
MMTLRNVCRFLVLWFVLIISVSVVLGQEQTINEKPVNEKDLNEKTVNEKTVYIPYEKLRNIFEQHGRGVFMPYDEFKALWDAARARQPVKPSAAIPINAMITETSNTATITEEVVRVESTISIELLKDGWHEIPLRLSDAAITKAVIGNEKAKILGSSNGGYRLLVKKSEAEKTENAENNENNENSENNAQKPEHLELTLHYAKSIEKSPGRNSVSFEVPQSPLGRWKIIVPESGVKIDFTPLVAAAEQNVTENETVFEAFIGTVPKIQIAWTPKAEGATGLDALTSVQLLQQTTIDENILRTSARFDYSISRAAITNLAVRIPKDQKVAGVFDPNIRKWFVEPKEADQIIRIELFEPARERQTVQLEFEKLRNNNESKVIVPEISVVDAGRMQGILVVRAADELTIEPVTSNGLLRMDASELPETLRKSGNVWDAAYRIPATSYTLELEVGKVEPRITATSQINVRLLAGSLYTQILTMFDIEKAGIFQVSFEIPAGSQIQGVTGRQVQSDVRSQIQSATGMQIQPVMGNKPDEYLYQSIEVASHTLAPTVKNALTQTLTVNFKRKAVGKVGLFIMFAKQFNEPDLQSPTGKSVDIPIILPSLSKGIAEKSDGKLLLCAKNMFRINPADIEGLQQISLQQLQSPAWHIPIDNDAQLGFLVADSDAKLTLRAERRQPQLTLRELRTVRIDEGSIKNEAKFYYEILFSTIKSLRIDVPEKLSGRLNISGAGKGKNPKVPNDAADWREQMMTPQPDDVAEGYVAWEFATKSNLSGTGVLELSWDDELAQLEIGKSLSIDIPRLLPKKQQPADRIWGQIIVSKSQSIDLGESETMKGLKPIDPLYDISEQDRMDNAVAAFEFHDDWLLQLIATRYKIEEVKRTSIEHGLVRANLSFSKFGTEISAQALFRIRSVLQRLDFAMPSYSKIDSVRINGQRVVLETDNADGTTPRFMIPLTSVPPDTPFLLDIRYFIPPDCKNRIEIPSFPDSGGSSEPAVQKVYLAVFVPQQWVITGYDKGIWSKDFTFYRGSEFINVVNQPNIPVLLSDTFLKNLSNDFSVQGTPYLFSALHPREGDSLRVYVCGDKIGTVFFCAAVIIGLYLLRYSWIRRFQITIFLAILCVLLGFAFPTGTQLLAASSALGWGVKIVAISWILQALYQGVTALRNNRKMNNRQDVETQQHTETQTPAENQIRTETQSQQENQSAESVPTEERSGNHDR